MPFLALYWTFYVLIASLAALDPSAVEIMTPIFLCINGGTRDGDTGKGHNNTYDLAQALDTGRISSSKQSIAEFGWLVC